jgi:hypothetical protein
MPLVNGDGVAYDQLNSVDDIVSEKLAKILSWAEAAKLTANETIDSIGTINVPNIQTVIPGYPAYNTTLAAPSSVDSTVPTGTVSNDPETAAFTPTDQVQFVDPGVIPDPVYGSALEVPSRPSDSVELPPVEYPTVLVEDFPTAPTYTIPVAPTISSPEPPALLSINIPDAPTIDIQPFGEEIPEFDAQESQLNLYVAEVEALLVSSISKLDASQAAYKTSESTEIRTPYLEGGNKVMSLQNGDLQTNLAHQRKRLMDEAASLIDREVMSLRKEAMEGWAGRNFSTAPGMLVDQINELEIESGRKLREASSEINQNIAEVAKQDIEKLLTIYAQLEQALIELNLERIRRAVEVEKLRVQSHMQLFNATLSLYLAKQEVIGANIDAYNAELSATLEITSGSTTAIKGAIAETAENQARTSIYRSQTEIVKAETNVFTSEIRAVTAPLDAFKYELLGVKANSDTIVANIDAYRQAVKGYAAAVDASAAEISAYAVQVQAAGSAAGVAETNARAYAVYIQESVRSNNAYKTYAEQQTDVLSANLQTFRDAAQVNEGFLRAEAARVGGQVDIERARAGAYGQYARHVSGYNAALEARTNAAQVHSLVSAENVARAQAIANQAQAETDRINAGALAGKTSAVAALAQGAMTAVNVRASAEGGSSTTNSYDYQLSTTSNWGGNKNLNEINVEKLSA